MNRKLDVLFVHPGDADILYQGLSNKYSAIEIPTWSLLLAQSCRSIGYGVAILDCDAERLTYQEAVKRIKEYDPRLVCFVVYGQNPNAGTTKMTGAVRVADLLKKHYPEYKTCFVGSHTSALPREVLAFPYVDFVLVGEGVYALRNLLATDLTTDLQNVKGIGWKSDSELTLNASEIVVPIERMDVDLPGSAWDLLPYKNKPFDLYRSCNWHANFHEEDRSPYAAMYTSLGCRFACTFCMINLINRTDYSDGVSAANSKMMRFWSPDFMIKQFDKLYLDYGVKTIRISDELFFLDKRYFEPLINQLAERQYPLNMWTYSRVDTVRPKYLDQFKKAGVSWLAIGVECLAPDSIIFTTAGLKKIKDVNVGDGIISYDTEEKKFVKTFVANKLENKKELIKISVSKDSIECSPEHRFFVLDDDCDFCEVQAKDLKIGDFVVSSHRDGVEVSDQDFMNEEQAQLLGFMIGDGYFGKNGIKITSGYNEKYLLEKYADIANRNFKVSTHIYKTKKEKGYNWVLTITGKFTIMKWLDDMGLLKTKSKTKFIPKEIYLSSNKVVSAFIAGLWDSDGSIYHYSKNGISTFLSFNNKELLESARNLMLYRLGISSSRIKKHLDERYFPPKDQYKFDIKKISELHKLSKLPIMHQLKKDMLNSYLSSRSGKRNSDYIFVPKLVLDRFSELNYGNVREIDRQCGFIRMARSNCVGRRLIGLNQWNKFLDFISNPDNGVVVDDLVKKYIEIINSGIRFERVKQIKQQSRKKHKVFDLTIDKCHNYIANGFLVHNSSNTKIRREVTKGTYEEVDVRDVTRQINDSGISNISNYIFGLPEDNFETMHETLELALDLNTEMANFYPAFALPGSPLYYAAKEQNWEMPKTFDAWSFHSYECLPLPTKYLSSAEVLKFRDKAWQLYFTRDDYLTMIEKKFGVEASNHIKEMTKIKLKRRIVDG